MHEYMDIIGLGADFKKKTLKDIFKLIDEDKNKNIDKMEMYHFINTLLAGKEEMLKLCEDNHDHSHPPSEDGAAAATASK